MGRGGGLRDRGWWLKGVREGWNRAEKGGGVGELRLGVGDRAVQDEQALI